MKVSRASGPHFERSRAGSTSPSILSVARALAQFEKPERLMRENLISCLCVTENRPEFMPWLLWCYDRQTYPHRELVIIDSSPAPFDPGERADVRVIQMNPGATIGKKRNRAMQEARGEIFTWFDDDDWQHPQKCALLADTLRVGAAWAGCAESWFVNLSTQTCSRFSNPGRQPIFNGAGFKTVPIKSRKPGSAVPSPPSTDGAFAASLSVGGSASAFGRSGEDCTGAATASGGSSFTSGLPAR